MVLAGIPYRGSVSNTSAHCGLNEPTITEGQAVPGTYIGQQLNPVQVIWHNDEGIQWELGKSPYIGCRRDENRFPVQRSIKACASLEIT